jgi:hypothetical protein
LENHLQARLPKKNLKSLRKKYPQVQMSLHPSPFVVLFRYKSRISLLSADDSDDDSDKDAKEKDLAKSSGNLRNTIFGGISKKTPGAAPPVKDTIEVKRNTKVLFQDIRHNPDAHTLTFLGQFR